MRVIHIAEYQNIAELQKPKKESEISKDHHYIYDYNSGQALFERMVDKIVNGDCIEVLHSFPDSSIDTVITSPPYNDQREYNGYSKNFEFETIAHQLYRVLKPGGVLVWVVGDSVSPRRHGETLIPLRQALYFKDVCGFIMHDTMIYEKNCFSFPSSRGENRYHQVFEYMFVFSKLSKPKTFNPIINDNVKRIENRRHSIHRQRDDSLKKVKRNTSSGVNLGMKTNIWKYNTGGYGTSSKFRDAYKHPAIFPEQLAVDHILSWSNEEDIVLDPMCGSGTTPAMAKKLKRHFIGVDICEEYCEIASRRIVEVDKGGQYNESH